MSGDRLRIAVVGGGVAGIAAAHRLMKRHAVTLFEGDPRLGGHANTVEIPGAAPDGGGLWVDTAFLIFNSGSYPLFLRLLEEWGVADRVAKTEMSFSIHNRTEDLYYALNRGLGPFFAQRRNLLDPSFYRIFLEILKFRKRAGPDLAAGRARGLSLAAYLRQGGYSQRFIESFLCPMGMSVWSVPFGKMMDFPAETFIRFLMNHHYLEGEDRAGYGWKTMRGGSIHYVNAFRKGFTGELRLGQRIASIARGPGGATLTLADGTRLDFDRVVIATHADQALRLLADPSDEERRLLGPWKYQKNETTLHTDASLLPGNRHAWGSWNIGFEPDGKGGARSGNVTYYLNRVQNLDCRGDYFITLDDGPVAEEKVLRRFTYDHPVFDDPAVATQPELASLNGRAGTYFCGSYFGFGFHEDAIASAFAAAERIDEGAA